MEIRFPSSYNTANLSFDLKFNWSLLVETQTIDFKFLLILIGIISVTVNLSYNDKKKSFSPYFWADYSTVCPLCPARITFG
ncbi:hypothetical protein CHRYSEO8AT_470100 [Chryseobacterium sp. 8AT]|nr:hypothetical protein CHRYSEO8AT_470100 [Chryseobacterium sp. 8AT]